MKNIVLIGPPGSGKGTLSKKLQNVGYLQISTGDLLREEIASGSELGKKIAEKIDNGFMVEDHVSLAVMKKAMKTANQGSIFDGYPRNLKQAELLELHLHEGDPQNLIILFLNIEPSKIIERIIYRTTCGNCGEILNFKFKQPLCQNDKNSCPACHSENLIKRNDDNKESLENRLKTYFEKTYPVVKYYSSFKNFYEINADDSEENIWLKVSQIIN